MDDLLPRYIWYLFCWNLSAIYHFWQLACQSLCPGGCEMTQGILWEPCLVEVKYSKKEVVRIVQSAPSKLSSLSLRWSCLLPFHNVSPNFVIVFLSCFLVFVFPVFKNYIFPVSFFLVFSSLATPRLLWCPEWLPPQLPQLAAACPALPSLSYSALPCSALPKCPALQGYIKSLCEE